MPEFWASVAHQFTSGGTRTDVLRPLVWPSGLLLFALIAGAAKGVPTWVLILVSTLLVMFFLLYLGAYIAFGRTDPNLLRSERHNLERMKIERGIYGDSTTGITAAIPPQITGPSPETPESDRP